MGKGLRISSQAIPDGLREFRRKIVKCHASFPSQIGGSSVPPLPEKAVSLLCRQRLFYHLAVGDRGPAHD